MHTCSLLRGDALEVGRNADSDDLRKLATVVAELCRKIEELERGVKDLHPEDESQVAAVTSKPR
jgi:hypothetical protein